MSRFQLEFIECAAQVFRVEGDSPELLCYPAFQSPHNFRQDVAWKMRTSGLSRINLAHSFQSASNAPCIASDWSLAWGVCSLPAFVYFENRLQQVGCLNLSRVRTLSLQLPQKFRKHLSFTTCASRFTRAVSVACRQHGSCPLL